MVQKFNIVCRQNGKESIDETYTTMEEALKALAGFAERLYEDGTHDIFLITDFDQEVSELLESGEEGHIEHARWMERNMKQGFRPGYYGKDADGHYTPLYLFGDDYFSHDTMSCYIEEEDVTPSPEQLEEKEIPYYSHHGQLGVLLDHTEFNRPGVRYMLDCKDFEADQYGNCFVPLNALNETLIEGLLDGRIEAYRVDSDVYGYDTSYGEDINVYETEKMEGEGTEQRWELRAFIEA